MRRPFAALLLLAACGQPLPPRSPGGESPLAFDAADTAAADRITVLIPGVLASVDIFGPSANWAGHGVVRYRLPGMDGLALDHALDIETAARTIADFAARYPDKPLNLVGYSAGAAIALSAAARIERPLTVAAISPSPGRAGGAATFLRGTRDMAAAAIRARSLSRRAIWEEYWKTLLFGRRNRLDPAFSQRIADLDAAHEGRITEPRPELVRAHSAALRHWTPPDRTRLSHVRIGFFVGLEDPVFSLRQTDGLRRKTGGGRIFGYRDDGHLLLLTRPGLFEHVRRFLDGS